MVSNIVYEKLFIIRYKFNYFYIIFKNIVLISHLLYKKNLFKTFLKILTKKYININQLSCKLKWKFLRIILKLLFL